MLRTGIVSRRPRAHAVLDVAGVGGFERDPQQHEVRAAVLHEPLRPTEPAEFAIDAQRRANRPFTPLAFLQFLMLHRALSLVGVMPECRAGRLRRTARLGPERDGLGGRHLPQPVHSATDTRGPRRAH